MFAECLLNLFLKKTIALPQESNVRPLHPILDSFRPKRGNVYYTDQTIKLENLWFKDKNVRYWTII